MPYVKWMAGVEELTKEDEMPVGRNVLELNNIMQSANYTCVAISSLGMIEATAQITVKGKELFFVILLHGFQRCRPTPECFGCSQLTAFSCDFSTLQGKFPNPQPFLSFFPYCSASFPLFLFCCCP